MRVPIPENVCRVQVNYSLANTDEIMVNTFHVKMTAGGVFSWADQSWPDLTKELADRTVEKLRAHWTDIHARTPNTVHLRDVRAYHLAADTGLTIDEGISVPNPGLQGVASNGTVLPPEVCMLLRLNAVPPTTYVPVRTGATRPAARRHGRLYLPPCDPNALDGTGMLQQAVADFLATSWGAFFNDVQGMHLGNNGALFPSVGVLSHRSGEFHQLESVTVPRLLAVQRRRQNRLSFTTSSAVAITHS